MEDGDRGGLRREPSACDRTVGPGAWPGATGSPSAPLPLRWAAVGAGVLGAVGSGAGLAIGLVVHPATAPFALLELGMPAMVAGALLGLAGGSIAGVAKRLGRRRRA